MDQGYRVDAVRRGLTSRINAAVIRTTGLPPQPEPVFVGRERELATLRASLAATLAGHGRVVMLAGEPGIGKTRLAEKLAREASERGATVRWGRCWEGPGAPAFWPWVQILRAQFTETDPAELRAQLRPGAEDVVQLVPELHELLPGITLPQPVEVATTRFRLLDSVARFLTTAASRQPLTLIPTATKQYATSRLSIFSSCLTQRDKGKLASCPDAGAQQKLTKAAAKVGPALTKKCSDAVVQTLNSTSFGGSCATATTATALASCQVEEHDAAIDDAMLNRLQ